MKSASVVLLLLYCLSLSLSAHAQEENATVEVGKHYIDLKVRSLEKCNRQVAKQQERLLNRLKRKEKRYAAKLKRNDSASYAKYNQQPLSYDSISKLSKADTATVNRKPATSPTIDSLKRIGTFLQNKSKLAGDSHSIELNSYDSKLSDLNKRGSYRTYINDLIEKRTNGLKNINSTSVNHVSGFTGIEKNVFYEKERLNVFKQMSDNPSAAEDKALEVLQGQKGFYKYMQGNNVGRQSDDERSTSLEQMGYQTKQSVTGQLQKKYGSALPQVAGNMTGQIKSFQDKMTGAKSAIKNAKQTANSAKHLNSGGKPSFKVNPMRGIPLWRRIEKQYNYQTTRATLDGQPATFQLSAMAGFKHTPRLTYGLGIAQSTGLGQGWNNIRFSFEGLGLRSYATWLWQYGIHAYAGYERMYKHAVFTDTKDVLNITPENNHNTNTYNESILVGITKTYQMNDKWNGSVQVLYDLWWKEKGLRSPFVLRFATIKK